MTFISACYILVATRSRAKIHSPCSPPIVICFTLEYVYFSVFLIRTVLLPSRRPLLASLWSSMWPCCNIMPPINFHAYLFFYFLHGFFLLINNIFRCNTPCFVLFLNQITINSQRNIASKNISVNYYSLNLSINNLQTPSIIIE